MSRECLVTSQCLVSVTMFTIKWFSLHFPIHEKLWMGKGDLRSHYEFQYPYVSYIFLFAKCEQELAIILSVSFTTMKLKSSGNWRMDCYRHFQIRLDVRSTMKMREWRLDMRHSSGVTASWGYKEVQNSRKSESSVFFVIALLTKLKRQTNCSDLVPQIHQAYYQ